MKIFVTGACGFIGTAFCRAAAAQGHEILGLKSNASPEAAANGIRHVVGSLEKLPWPEIERFAPDAALHLAWIVTPGLCLDTPENDLHVKWSVALFKGLIERGVRHLAGTGSALEYAPSSKPLREDSPITSSPSRYAAGKLAVCRSLEGMAASHGIHWTWFRTFFAYGKGEHADRLIPSLWSRLSTGRPVVLNTPHSIKDFVHVQDVAAGLLTGLEHKLTGIVNLGSGTGVSIRDLALQIAHLAGADPALVVDKDQPDPDPLPVAVADVSRLRFIGWEPSVTLNEGLRHQPPT